MKVDIRKRLSKILKFYKTNFNILPPYNVLVDGTFCDAMSMCTDLIAQLENYLRCPINVCTTNCTIVEVELLQKKFGIDRTKCINKMRALTIAECRHEIPIVAVGDCFETFYSKNDDETTKTYCIATQDTQLSKAVQKCGGIPLLTVSSYGELKMEQPSAKSWEMAKEKTRLKMCTPAFRLEALEAIKQDLGLLDSEEKEKKKKKKKSRRKKRKHVEEESNDNSEVEEDTEEPEYENVGRSKKIGNVKQITEMEESVKKLPTKRRRRSRKKRKYEPDILTLIQKEFNIASRKDNTEMCNTTSRVG